MVEINKILFPCDLTESLSKLLPHVLSVAEKYNSTIYMLHVVKRVDQLGMSYLSHPPLVEDFHKEALEGAEEAMNKVCQEQLESCPNFQKKIISGDPAIEILKFIESEDIDLLIMGTHGRKGLDHAIFGSVAEKVIRSSPVPVLIVNPYKLK